MLCFVGFIVFEFAIGMYFPTMGTIKATVVEDNCRTTMYNLFQIPMNLAMIAVLYAEPSIILKMTICTVSTGVALFLMLGFRAMDNEKTEKEADSSEDEQ